MLLAKINFKIDFCRLKIQFVELDFSKFKYRSTFTITCNEGHTLKPGSETTVECTEGGITGESKLLDLPTCEEGMIQFVLHEIKYK